MPPPLPRGWGVFTTLTPICSGAIFAHENKTVLGMFSSGDHHAAGVGDSAGAWPGHVFRRHRDSYNQRFRRAIGPVRGMGGFATVRSLLASLCRARLGAIYQWPLGMDRLRMVLCQ